MIHSRTTIQLLMQCQRLIQKEFNKRIALDDEQIVTMIFAYSAQSSSADLKVSATALSHQFLVDQSTSPEEEEQSSATSRVYRGQAMDQPNSADDKPENSSGKTRTITYRGQKLEVAC